MTDDHIGDGRKGDPNAGRATPGNQERAMDEDEALDVASNDSMDASDPLAMTQPGGHDPASSSGFPGDVTEDIGGVQGSGPSEQASSDAAGKRRPGAPPDDPAPDAGEIEWAGGFIKKAPSPGG